MKGIPGIPYRFFKEAVMKSKGQHNSLGILIAECLVINSSLFVFLLPLRGQT